MKSFSKNQNCKNMAFALVGLFVLAGCYNAVVINSESHITSAEVKFLKRLDEVYGVTISGRKVAGHWQKLNRPVIPSKIPTQIENKIAASSVTAPAVDLAPAESVQEELNLSLVEVSNSKKWQNGLTANQFNGSLATNNGVIESLSVSLPNNEVLSVAFSELTGNVFEYDFNGEIYSGMMYQVDQHSYMVTLTNGPLGGTKLRFSAQGAQEAQQEFLAENNVEAGSLGNNAQAQESSEQLAQADQLMQQEAVEAQSFNMEQSQSM